MILRSLSVRLTLYTFLLTYLLLIGCWGVVYFSINRELFFRDQETISDRLKTIQNLMQIESHEPTRLIRRVEMEWPNRPFERIYVRILDGDKKLITETPGLNSQYEDILQAFPPEATPLAAQNPLQKVNVNSRIFEVGSFVVAIAEDGLQTRRYIQVALERTSEERLLSTLRESLVFVLVFGLIGSLWIGRMTVFQTLKSIREISETARKVSLAGLTERVDVRALPSEFEELALTLNEMLQRLEESFLRLGRFSEDMAHELRTPLNNLLGSLEVGLTKKRSIDEYESLIVSCIEECTRLKRIIDSLLFIARAAQPTQELQKQNLNPIAEIEDILSFYEASAEKKNLRLQFTHAGEFSLSAERVLFQRALGNLLSNAIRHSPEGGRIEVRAEKVDDFVRVQVQDGGEGISPELLPRVGERFFRAEASRSTSSGGHGLGLSIVKSIMEVHKGRLEVASEPGHGAAFSLYFPA